MSESKTSARRIQAAERQAKAVQMRMEGANYEAIGREIGTTAMGAHKAVTKWLDTVRNQTAETAAQMLTVELARLDELQSSLWQDAKAGKLPVIDRVLAISDRRAKLLGLDKMPQENTQVKIIVEYIDEPPPP